jgi:hypothetical protein
MTKKLRVKAIPFDNTATEATPGEWEWVLKGRTWRWRTSASLNLFIVYPAGNVAPLPSVPGLYEAAIFAEGFTAGYDLAKIEPSTSVPGMDLEVQSDTTSAEPIGPGGPPSS